MFSLSSISMQVSTVMIGSYNSINRCLRDNIPLSRLRSPRVPLSLFHLVLSNGGVRWLQWCGWALAFLVSLPISLPISSPFLSFHAINRWSFAHFPFLLLCLCDFYSFLIDFYRFLISMLKFYVFIFWKDYRDYYCIKIKIHAVYFVYLWSGIDHCLFWRF